MTIQHDNRQREFDVLTRKVAAGTITQWEYFQRARLFYELHPEKMYWTNGWTPAQMWSTWAIIGRGLHRLWRRFHEEIICFGVSLSIMMILLVFLCLSHH